MKRFISSVILLLIAVCVWASDGYKIQLTVAGLKDTKVYLAFYYNGKTYSKDSTILDSKGVGFFSNKEKLPEGTYIVYFNPDKYFDLLVGADQNIKVEADTSDFSKVTVTGSVESVQFQELINFMGRIHKEQSELRQKYTDQKIDTLTFVQQLNQISDKVAAFQDKQIAENEGTFLASFIKGTIPVEVPEMENLPDSLRPMARYQHMKNHFLTIST